MGSLNGNESEVKDWWFYCFPLLRRKAGQALLVPKPGWADLTLVLSVQVSPAKRQREVGGTGWGRWSGFAYSR